MTPTELKEWNLRVRIVARPLRSVVPVDAPAVFDIGLVGPDNVVFLKLANHVVCKLCPPVAVVVAEVNDELWQEALEVELLESAHLASARHYGLV